MGHKNVCLNCYRVENLGTDFSNLKTGDCPNCSNRMVFLNHKFRPPKKSETKKWDVIKFLISKGFIFQHIYQEGKSETYKTNSNNYIPYPKTMRDAIEFVHKYKSQAIKSK